jgi:hypothetical protein
VKYRASTSTLAILSGIGLVIVGHPTTGAVIDDFTDGELLLQATNYSPGATTLQTNLIAVLGGMRRVYAGSSANSVAKIDSTNACFTFEATDGFGYFDLGYGTEVALGLDLRADGSDAFQLSFAEVYTPGLPGTLGVSFRVNQTSYNLSGALHATNKAVTIHIPFAHFTNGGSFVLNQIRLIGIRVPFPSRLVLDSISTVKSAVAPRLIIAAIGTSEVELRWSTNDVGYIVETASAVFSESWDRISNSVSIAGEEFSVIAHRDFTNSFFRLRRLDQ